MFCIFPVKKNRIIFNSQKGRQYACSPRAIFEYLEGKYGKQLEYVWCLQNPPESFPRKPYVVTVSYNSLRYFYYQMTSKVIVANIPSPCYVPRRKQQFMIDTWHGGGAYKRVGISVPKQDSLSGSSQSVISGADVSDNARWELYKAHYNAKDTSLFLSSSKMFTEVMYDSQMIPRDQYYEVGMPRNDIFFKDYTEIKNKVHQFFGIPNEKKILLYVPSFRDDGDIECYKLDYDKILKTLEKKFGSEWVCISRLHPRAKKFDSEIIPEDNPNIIDGTFYPDIQELLVSSDSAISDYSSCIFDFMMSRKPGFIFATDIEKFNTDRGFYYPLETTPFPISRNNEQMIENIENFDIEKYKKDIEEFIKNKGCTEDGHASERTADLIEEIMEK